MELLNNKINILNPKQNKGENINLYPYYAGFSNQFATELIKTCPLSPNSVILDPWNGSGTTVKSSSICGYKSIGIDLNPAMVVIAKGNTLPNSEFSCILSLYKEIKKKSTTFRQKIEKLTQDPLNNWFSTQSTKEIRSIELSIRDLLMDDQNIDNKNWINNLSCISSFFYIALFRTLNNYISSFKTSNPTWIKKAKNETQKIHLDSDSLLNTLCTELKTLIEIGKKETLKYSKESIVSIGSSTNLDLKDSSIDLVLTSPPYCTRIDYAIATSIELAVLNFSTDEQDKLRRQLIGTSTVPKIAPSQNEIWGSTCNKLIDNIKNHYSKASNTYYLKNHLQYFDSLSTSINEISRVLKKGGLTFMVVQDSFYKDTYNDLPRICIEMASFNNLKIREKIDFSSNQSMVGLNKKAKIYRNNNFTTESVLCFEK